jgi:hypothetical protein
MKQDQDQKGIGIYKENYLLNSVFVKDTDLQFIFKKTEKIVTAIYLVTNFLVTEEPLKWSLRNSASGLLKTLMSFSQSSLSDKEKMSHNLSVAILELNSYFDLAYHSGFVSQMNYEILNFEISKLTATIAEYNSEAISSNKGLFDSGYFHVEKMPGNDDFYKGHEYKGQNRNIKDNVFYKDIKDKYEQPAYNTNNIANNRKDTDFYKGQNTSKKDNKENRRTNKKSNEDRREKIIAEVKRQKSVSVKDIAKVISDCSEKTLQRELLGMVDDGILIKKGERRWSRYSLK